jgi:ABC-type transporter Mla maintaining outer membrane lipid asymmetry permease subunit MlaE
MIVFLVLYIILLFASLSIIGFVGGILIRLSDIGIRYDEFLKRESGDGSKRLKKYYI